MPRLLIQVCPSAQGPIHVLLTSIENVVRLGTYPTVLRLDGLRKTKRKAPYLVNEMVGPDGLHQVHLELGPLRS